MITQAPAVNLGGQGPPPGGSRLGDGGAGRAGGAAGVAGRAGPGGGGMVGRVGVGGGQGGGWACWVGGWASCSERLYSQKGCM